MGVVVEDVPASYPCRRSDQSQGAGGVGLVVSGNEDVEGVHTLVAVEVVWATDVRRIEERAWVVAGLEDVGGGDAGVGGRLVARFSDTVAEVEDGRRGQTGVLVSQHGHLQPLPGHGGGV